MSQLNFRIFLLLKLTCLVTLFDELKEILNATFSCDFQALRQS